MLVGSNSGHRTQTRDAGGRCDSSRHPKLIRLAVQVVINELADVGRAVAHALEVGGRVVGVARALHRILGHNRSRGRRHGITVDRISESVGIHHRDGEQAVVIRLSGAADLNDVAGGIAVGRGRHGYDGAGSRYAADRFGRAHHHTFTNLAIVIVIGIGGPVVLAIKFSGHSIGRVITRPRALK